MQSVKLDTLKPSHRENLESLLNQWKKLALDAFDRQESVSVHSHQEMKYFGTPDLLNEFIFLGWSFGLSIGDYPKQDAVHPGMRRGKRKRVKKNDTVSSPA